MTKGNKTCTGGSQVTTAERTRIAIAKWWRQKAQSQVTTSLSIGNPGTPSWCYNLKTHELLRRKRWESQVKTAELSLGVRETLGGLAQAARKLGNGMLLAWEHASAGRPKGACIQDQGRPEKKDTMQYIRIQGRDLSGHKIQNCHWGRELNLKFSFGE